MTAAQFLLCWLVFGVAFLVTIAALSWLTRRSRPSDIRDTIELRDTEQVVDLTEVFRGRK